MNRKYPMILVMKSMLQFVAVMDKLIQMIAMLKMQVSQNGLKASVNKKPELHQAPHSWGFKFFHLFVKKWGWGNNLETHSKIILYILY